MATQSAKVEEIKTTEQLFLSKAFQSTKTLERQQKYDEEAPHLVLQVVQSIVLNRSLRLLTNLQPDNICTDNNNKHRKCVT